MQILREFTAQHVVLNVYKWKIFDSIAVNTIIFLHTDIK